MKAIENGKIPAEKEVLTRENHLNEYLLTGLRTIWGCDTKVLEKYHFNIFSERSQELQKYKTLGWLEIDKNTIRLTEKGRLFADEITANLFIV